MRSITTGMGLAILGACVLGAAAISSSKGNQAMAQTGSERRIVNMGVYGQTRINSSVGMAYRVWSDGVIETRCVGELAGSPDWYYNNNYVAGSFASSWAVVDNGQTPSFQPTDTNIDGSVDAADIGKVLLDYGAMQEVTPVPTIDCQTSTIP
jgi:hypothetical protein